MEHLIVSGEGAGDAIAFGRSRIAYLRSLGLPHVSQTFKFGEWQVRVKLVPGHEYIYVDGGCPLSMDSGVIDLRSSVPWFPEFALPGLRVPTSVTEKSEAEITTLVAGVPTDDSKPEMLTGSGIAGRTVFAGEKTRGTITRPNAATRSFMPVVQEAEGQWRFSSSDENVISKKWMTMNCPASIFTGLCRDWIQAVYGRFLYADFHDGGTQILPLSLAQQPGSPPALMAQFHRDGRLETPTPAARVTTSAGVHKDTDGKHWLFLPSDYTDTLDVFQLRSNSCGEALRKALSSDPPPWVGRFSSDDMALLEAYILAYSLPVQDTWQQLSVAEVKHSANAMGYGWHWNRTGLVADRIINDTFVQGKAPNAPADAYNVAMRSTHQRLAISGSSGNWNASVSVVRGPYDWAVERGLCVILEPWYGEEGGSWKTTPYYTELFEYGGANFYAWYRGDELMTASVSLSRIEETPPVGRCTPPDFELFSLNGAGELYGWRRGQTVGTRGGEAEIVQKIAPYWEYKLNVAGQSFTMRPGRMERGSWFSLSDKEEEPDPMPPTPNGTGVGPDGVWAYGQFSENYLEGYPPYEYYYRPAGPNERIAASAGRQVNFLYDVDQFAFTRNYPGKVVIAVPHGDSEAIYARGEAYESKVDAAFSRARESSRYYAWAKVFAFAYGTNPVWIVGPRRIEYQVGSFSLTFKEQVSSTPVPQRTTTGRESFISLIVTRCPEVAATEDDWDLSPSVWWFGQDIVPESFYTRTSAMGKVALIGKKFGESVGVDQAPSVPAIVGAT